MLQYGAWILDLFSSAFSNTYFERVADSKFKTAKKIWTEAVTAYYEYPSQNFLCEPEKLRNPENTLLPVRREFLNMK
jgi:hypothetical protein